MKYRVQPSLLALAITACLTGGCTHFNVVAADQQADRQKAAAAATAASTLAAPAPPVAAAASKPAPPAANMLSNNTAGQECTPEMAAQSANYYLNDNGNKAEELKVRATGYGAPPKAFYSEPQRRLMSMRAAKIDAYRSLAERVNGMQIWGGTTVGDMVVEKDRYRVYVDTYLRGARVIAENPQEDGTFETVVEMKVDRAFLAGVLSGKPSAANGNNPCGDMRGAQRDSEGAMAEKMNANASDFYLKQ